MIPLKPPFFLPISLYFYNFLKPPPLKNSYSSVPINFPLIFELDSNILSLSSLKKLYFAIALSSSSSLLTLRDYYKKMRAIVFNMISIYIETILIYNHELVDLLEKNTRQLEKQLNLEKGVIDRSKRYFEKKGEIEPNYLISLSWSVIAMKNENKKDLNKKEMIVLIQIQIEQFKKESILWNSFLNKFKVYKQFENNSFFNMILSARVDDLCLMKGFSELDYIHNIKNFRNDADVHDLIMKRGDILKQISLWRNTYI